MGSSAISSRLQGASRKSPKNNLRRSFRSPKRTHALLSIKPEYASAIFRGEKRFEFRRAIFRKPVDIVVVYTSSPVSRVEGEFDIEGVIRDTVEGLWSRTNNFAGIDRDRFFEYFAGRDVAYAIVIGSVRRYPHPLDLSVNFGIRPPQSFVYI